MRIFIGVTDENWYKYLKSIQPDEVNFWQPNSSKNFKALNQGELFLFKLHAPKNYIVGGGVFVRQVFLPVTLTWDVFGAKNGTRSLNEFLDRIDKYRNIQKNRIDPVVSSLILSTPFFFDEPDWIPIPKSWSPNIVQGKTYNTDTIEGKSLYDAIKKRLSTGMSVREESARYGEPQIIKPRLGQGGFRVIVTEAYHRSCAITGEKTLPVLNASHIKPYSMEGPHTASNGLLLRQDIHTLFDRGYITINEDNVIEVSRRIKEDYGNGKEYYAFHGNPLTNIPDKIEEMPSQEFLLWHNENVFAG
ncbi:MAG: HNH endonuclease [Firmicutes bacterium]|nr:HNH endonuclease [Bacillota bacterium]